MVEQTWFTNLFKLKFTDYERADTNFHDDYTPLVETQRLSNNQTFP